MPRILLVSNRLPITAHKRAEGLRVEPSTGGLATGLRSVHDRMESAWIGWPGKTDDLPPADRVTLEGELTRRRLVPVYLSNEEVEEYYEGVSNGLLWPIFHSLLEHVPLEDIRWDAYQHANERFADAVVANWRDGDLIWVHDYQLMALPAILRARLPRARIGFFLHIPFPTVSIFRTLPFGDRLLRGLMGADVIGFHTASFMRNFSSSLLRGLGVETVVDVARYQGRDVRVGTFPMGIDALAWTRLGKEPEIALEAQKLRETHSCSIFLGIDRLDYTKGIARRLLAFERLLVDHPALREKVRMIQVAVPSRAEVIAYKRSRQETDTLVGRIQGKFATAKWSPVHYIYRPLGERDVAAMYRAADAMLVTPIRDGMNLVAKEFVAARSDEDGVLILSEFAGAASELAGALRVNPYDIGGTAKAMAHALEMPREERRERMRTLRDRVLAHDARWWSDTFLEALQSVSEHRAGPMSAAHAAGRIERAIERLRHTSERVILLDYDGTLVPFHEHPELAAPDDELYEILHALHRKPRTRVHLISGRTRDVLEDWFGKLPIGLHAEHGLWMRQSPTSAWQRKWAPELPRQERIASIMEEFAQCTPGAEVEYKSSGIAWHWRRAEPEFGESQGRELQVHLIELLSNVGVEVVAGDKVIEVRPHGVHKGLVLSTVLEDVEKGALVLAIGDDRTDEDLFARLPPDSVSIHVGPNESRAELYLPDPTAVRAFLRAIAD